VRLRAVLGIGFLVLAAAGTREVDAPRTLTSIQIKGGDEDDRGFAAAALGLQAGQPVDTSGFQRALAAVRLVDRYRSVEGVLGTDGSAVVNLIRSFPWPPGAGKAMRFHTTSGRAFFPSFARASAWGPCAGPP